MRPETRWAVGCLISGTATAGLLILVFELALALQPPTWMQIVIGSALAVGGAILAWTIASALGRAGDRRSPDGVMRYPHSVRDTDRL